MSKPMQLDEFLEAQSSGYTATIEAIPEKPTHVKVTPFHNAGGCGCAASIELPRAAIQSVTGTGTFHFCCGKRLEVAIVEFAEDATIPVADLMKQRQPAHGHGHDHDHHHGPSPEFRHEHESGRGHSQGRHRDGDIQREYMGSSPGPEGSSGLRGDGDYGDYAGYGGLRSYGDYESQPFGRTGPGGGTTHPPSGPGRPTALVGRWRVPWSRCTVTCINVCTRFCGPTGWACCGWETRCGIECNGPYWDPLPTIF